MQKNTASQKWIVFAFGGSGHASEGQPLTGDALNITANIRIDGGAANAVDDINPTELEDGYYVFDVTAAESNGDLIHISPESSTANVEVIGVPGAVWTVPASFPDEVIQTGDTYALANGAAGFVAIDTVVDAILVDTNELQTDDVPTLIATLDAVVDTVKAETALIVADTNELQTDDVPTLIATLDAVVDTVKAETALIVADTNELQTDDVPTLISTLDAVVDTVKAETVLILADTAEIGTAGAGLTDLGGMSTAMKAEVNVEAADVLFTDTDAEPAQGAPGATISLADKIGFLYKAWRNRSNQTATTYQLFNDDATTVDHKATVSDDATTAEKGEVATGP